MLVFEEAILPRAFFGIVTVPSDAGTSPDIIFMNGVLPEPFAPTRP
jgi:hypothetical protein